METDETTLTRTPPNDAAAELAVLCSMLFDKEALALSCEKLGAQDFYRPDYKEIFDAASALYHRNEPVDLITLKNELEKRDVFGQIGGNSMLATLAGGISTTANIRQYVKIVAEASVIRQIIKAGSDISAASFDRKKPLDQLLEFAEKSIFDISAGRRAEESTHISKVIVESVNRIEEIYKSGNKTTGVETGFGDFDHKTSGLQPSDLILIAARPSMGKTAFALNIAQHAAVRRDIPVALFSLEMSKEQLVNRLMCSEAMVDSQRLRTGELNPEDWRKISRAIGPLSGAPIYIDDTPGITIPELRSKCRKLKLEKGIKMIIIDYLQLMTGSGRESRQQEISEISRALKGLAREIDVPLIALSQLSRACESRADHHPMLSDLRESGAIEQDADVVVFLFRDEYYNNESEKKGVAEVIIAKQRNGPTGTVELLWRPEIMQFQSKEWRETPI